MTARSSRDKVTGKICPCCGALELTCIDSRTPNSVNACREDVFARRRYRCRSCEHRFSTVEIMRDRFDEIMISLNAITGENTDPLAIAALMIEMARKAPA